MRDRRRRRRTSSSGRSREGLDARPARHLGRARPDARRPHGRAARARRRAGRSSSTRRSRRGSRRARAAVAERLRRPYAEFAPGVRKQATRARGRGRRRARRARRRRSCSRPAACVAVDAARARRASCRRSGRAALETEPLRRLLARARAARAARAALLRRVRVGRRARRSPTAGGDGDGVEATICARDFEIHVDLVVEPGAERARRRARGARSPRRSREYLFARDDDADRGARARRSAASAG